MPAAKGTRSSSDSLRAPDRGQVAGVTTISRATTEDGTIAHPSDRKMFVGCDVRHGSQRTWTRPYCRHSRSLRRFCRAAETREALSSCALRQTAEQGGILCDQYLDVSAAPGSLGPPPVPPPNRMHLTSSFASRTDGFEIRTTITRR